MAMQKAIFSSPFAALESTQTRIRLLTQGRQPTADERQEVADLQAFAETLERIDASNFSKYQRLLAYLNLPSAAGVRTTRRTAWCSPSALRPCAGCTQCKRDLRLRDPQITLMHGQLSDTEQQDIVERFGRQEDRCACCCVRTWRPRG